jgi:predicted CXXCH cytochrome family protein
MARQRTQKTVSARIDRTYIDRFHRWRRLRRTTIFAATALAVILVAFAATGGKGELIHNPGRLTFVHASFQDNCAECHDGLDANGKSTGKFSKAVSDAACLKCHDAGIHHPNQGTMVTFDNRFNPPEIRSANCTSCHMEHRGQAALVSTSDLLCVNCHADLTGKTRAPPGPEVPLHVTDFTLDGHPHFGRSITTNGKMVDPTVLNFNHKKHLGGILKGDQQNCTFCHNPTPDAAQSLTWEIGKTAYSMPGSEANNSSPRPLVDGTGRHRSMTQVNYDKNCKSCHDLGTLPNSDSAVIPHADFAEVRKVILAYVTDTTDPWQKYAKDSPGAKEKALNDRIIGKLNVPSDNKDANASLDAVTKAVKAAPLIAEWNLGALTAKLPVDVVEKLQAAAIKLPTNIVPAADRTRVSDAVGSTTQPSDHLRPLVIQRLRTEVVKGLSGQAQQRMLADFDAAFARFNQDTPDPRLLEIYVAYGNDGGNSCIKCHEMEGDAAAVPPEWTGMQTSAKVTDAPVSAPNPPASPPARGSGTSTASSTMTLTAA